MRDYIARFRRSASLELRWFASRPDLATVIELAAMCRTPDGKRHAHQRRLPEASLRTACECLSLCDLESCGTFEELHDRIDQAIRDLPNIGELAVYDIACRIGAFLKLKPEVVYLHRGTRVGAHALGLGRGLDVLQVCDLPSAFRKLNAGEIEDCLCIYKDDLRRIRNQEASGRRRD